MDFDSIKKFIESSGCSTPCSYVNQEGENEVVVEGADEVGRFFKITTTQTNGWLRIDTYYEDGTIEETYRK